MNISQAKKIAGITFNVVGRENLDKAVKWCKQAIVAARKAGNDERAAELSEVKELFKKKTKAKNTCPDCGTTISRGSTHCRIHQRGRRVRALAAPLATVKETIEHRNNNSRVPIPENHLAPLGYFSDPVQAVIGRWQPSIKDEILEGYFQAVATAVIGREIYLNLRMAIPPSHWQALFELGAAIAQVQADKFRPDAWLLTGGEAAENGKFDSYEAIRTRIIKQGGPDFSVEVLRKAARRLKLSAPKDTASMIREIFRRS